MHPFQKGDTVEVLRTQNHHIWFPATVLRSAPAANRAKAQIYVEFETLSAAISDEVLSGDNDEQQTTRLREYVELAHVRPAPPLELHRFFKAGDIVEGFCVQKKGWRKAKVLDILEDSKYAVSFSAASNAPDDDGEEMVEEVEQWGLRALRDWDDGSWIPPIQPEKLSPMSDRNSSGVKLRIKCTSFAKLIEGMKVEVIGQEGGFQESWYPATIIKSLGNDKFLVGYLTLRTEDRFQCLTKEVDVICVRPCPPIIERVEPFEHLAQVDAWYNDGWWVGNISKVVEGVKYMVCFRNTSEEIMFEHRKLRPHQDWVEGNWIAACNRSSIQVEPNTKELKLRIKCFGKTSEQMFGKGMMVEVKSDEQGYLGSWFTAKVVGPIGNSKYLVEYQTLRTDDESEPLKETADSSYIRPCPPQIQKVGCYKMLEEVDAWYNDGWWVGLISRVLAFSEYAVYFWTSNEVLVFAYHDLRPHQEWICGKWTTAFRKKSNLLIKPKLGKLRRQNVEVGLAAYFCNGTKVEVKNDEEGYRDSWYPAMILKPLGNRKFLVEYQTLRTDDESDLLKEEADALCIRPSPPFVVQTDRYKPLEEVDVWYSEGWWVGQVYKVTMDAKYMVYLRMTKEVVQFQHSDLRPHLDWLNQQWVGPMRGRRQ